MSSPAAQQGAPGAAERPGGRPGGRGGALRDARRLVVVSAPQAVRGSKRRLMRWPRRGTYLAELLLAHDVSIAGLLEVGPRNALALARFARRLAFWRTAPNDHLGPRLEVGSGVAIDLMHEQRLDKATGRVKRPQYRRRWLKLPIVLTRSRENSHRLIAVVSHADRKRPDPTANRYVLDQTGALAARLFAATGVPVAVVMDTNNAAEADEIMRRHGLERLGGSGVCLIFGIGLRVVGRERLGGFAGNVTDHGDDPQAVDVVPTIVNTTCSRIPRRALTTRRRRRRRTKGAPS